MRKLIVASLGIFLLASCSPSITTKIYNQQEMLSEEQKVTVFTHKKQVPEGYTVLGTVDAEDNGFSVDCDSLQMMTHILTESRKAGGNAFLVTEHKSPSPLGSTCHQFKGFILSIPNTYAEQAEENNSEPNTAHATLTENTLQKQQNKHVYMGVGIGLDYGGLGVKLEMLPVKYIGLFGGVGYNLASLGWNFGATYKVLPDQRVSPNIMLMYGYNAVFVGTDYYSKRYNMTSYGVTTGIGIDVKLGTKGHKLTCGLYVPFRSKKFKDNYEAVKNNPYIELTNELLPFGFGVGLNFAL